MFDLCAVCLQRGVDIILTVTGTYLVFVLCVFQESVYHYCHKDVFGPRILCLLGHETMQPDTWIIRLQRNIPPLHSAHQ